jgi:hypothetical protein
MWVGGEKTLKFSCELTAIWKVQSS